MISEHDISERDALIHKLQDKADRLECSLENLRSISLGIGFEEIPDEELFEDGELNKSQVKEKIARRVLEVGDWTIVRRKDGNR